MTDQALPSFSIVAPTYNRSEIVEETIRRLLAMDYPQDKYEILVADNSSDGTPEMVKRMAATTPVPIRLLWRDERLPAVKRNLALREASGDLVVFINDDLWVEPDFLSQHAATHAASDEAIAVLGLVEQSPQMPQTPFIRWYRPFSYDEISDQVDRTVSYRYFWSMNISVPRAEMLGRNLVFHEDWENIGHEDVELGYRWTRAGRKVVFNPRARGEHYHPHSLASACRLQESIGRGLRDLEWLIPEPDLLERYGVFSWRNSPRAVLRGVARRAVFNRLTVPPLQRWIERRQSDSALIRWMYWKIMLFFTNRGYRQAPVRRPDRLVTGPPADTGREEQ